MICIRIILIWISFYEVQTLGMCYRKELILIWISVYEVKTSGICYKMEIINGNPIIKMYCCPGFHWDATVCRRGCPEGHYGRNCSVPCPYPEYGMQCKKKCNCSEERCNHDSGCTETGQTTSKVQTTTKQQEVTEVFEYTTSVDTEMCCPKADGQNAFFWISIGVIGSLLVITLTMCSFNLGLLQGIEYNGSTTVCVSVQNEVEPRGIQDGTMGVDNLRRNDNRPPSLRSVSS